MGMTIGLVLAFTSAFGWAAADALRKRLASSLSALELAVSLHWFQLPFLVFGLLIAHWLVPEHELSGLFQWRLEPGYWAWAAPTFVLNAAANLLFIRALQLSDLSLTIPYLSLTPVLAAFSGWVIVGEAPTTLGLVGVLVIGIGALVLNPGNAGRGLLSPFLALRKERGSWVMLGVACLWSVSIAFDKRALLYASPLTHTMILAFTGGIMLEAYRRRNSGESLRERVSQAPVLVVLTTGVITGALLLQLASYNYLHIAYVEAIKRSLGLVASVLIGWWLFGESSLVRRLAGVLVMALGVSLILLG